MKNICNYSKSSFKNSNQSFSHIMQSGSFSLLKPSFLKFMGKNFSGGHGAEPKEDDYFPRKMDRISYNVKLTGPEREK